MSHGEPANSLTGRSPAADAPRGYGKLPLMSKTPTTTLPVDSTNNPHSPGPDIVAPAGATMDVYGAQTIQRWVANGSDSHFNAISGAVGGFASGVATCPLDVIKTKLQAQGGMKMVSKGRHVGHHKVYEGLLGTSKIILREEGIKGMYRGLGPIILGYLPTWATWFTVYNKSKVWMADHNVSHNETVISFLSSIVAGGSSTVVTNPIWVIKTRLMSQSASGDRHISEFPRSSNTPTSRPSINSSWHYNSTLDAARKMYSSEGILSFYSGLTPALLGLTHVAVQFPAYEYLRKKFTGQRMGELDDGPTYWLGLLSASILSKILASSATYPHEVIRTRLQTQRRPMPSAESLNRVGSSQNGQSQNSAAKSSSPPQVSWKYRGILMTFRTILKEEGWRAFYAGMGVNMMRAVPAATVTMMTYEITMKKLKETRRLGQGKDETDFEVSR